MVNDELQKVVGGSNNNRSYYIATITRDNMYTDEVSGRYDSIEEATNAAYDELRNFIHPGMIENITIIVYEYNVATQTKVQVYEENFTTGDGYYGRIH